MTERVLDKIHSCIGVRRPAVVSSNVRDIQLMYLTEQKVLPIFSDNQTRGKRMAPSSIPSLGPVMFMEELNLAEERVKHLNRH